MNNTGLSIVMLGASGAVGNETLKVLSSIEGIDKITLLVRKKIANLSSEKIFQQEVNLFDPSTYRLFIKNHDVAICTLGVGQPSKISKEEFVKIDKLLVLDFAKECKQYNVNHFELLGSVGSNSKSSVFYLKTKGELVDELNALNFDRLSIFQPSMILTPKNRYGIGQAITLLVWPTLSAFFIGFLKPYRGVKVQDLGKAIALNVLKPKNGFEILTWAHFQKLLQHNSHKY